VRRRDFIGAMYAAAMALPVSAAARQPGKVWRIGDVRTGTPEIGGPFAQALEQRLADLGYVQDRNIVLLHRFAGPQPDKIEEAIRSLLPQVDLLVVWGEAAIAAKKLVSGVPTVFISIGFPVELGLVQSLAHPGGNMTGITSEAALETSRNGCRSSRKSCRSSNVWLSFARLMTRHSSRRNCKTWRLAISGSRFCRLASNRPTTSMLQLPV